MLNFRTLFRITSIQLQLSNLVQFTTGPLISPSHITYICYFHLYGARKRCHVYLMHRPVFFDGFFFRRRVMAWKMKAKIVFYPKWYCQWPAVGYQSSLPQYPCQLHVYYLYLVAFLPKGFFQRNFFPENDAATIQIWQIVVSFLSKHWHAKQ